MSLNPIKSQNMTLLSKCDDTIEKGFIGWLVIEDMLMHGSIV